MNKLLKYSFVVLMALVANSPGQRSVMVNSSNSVLLYPNNFWSVNASAARNGIGLSLSALTNTNVANFRNGIGLGTAATNPSSAFQPSSTVLSNLSLSNGVNLTNLTASSINGTVGLASNVSGNIAIANGGTGATNASTARANLELDSAATNPASAFQPSSFVLSNLASSNGFNLTNILVANVSGALATNGNAQNLTNFPALLLRTNGSASGLTNFPANVLTTNGNGAGLTNLTASSIIGTVAIASNLSSVLSVSNGGTGATNAATARANLGLGASNNVIFNDVQAVSFLVIDETNSQIVFEGNSAAVTRTNLGLGFNALTNTNGQNLLSELGIPFFSFAAVGGGSRPAAFALSDFGDENLYVLGYNADQDQWEIEHTDAFRDALSLGWSALTNTNSTTFQTALFGSNTNPVLVNTSGSIVSPTNFWQQAPIATTVAFSAPATNSTNAATNSRNLIIQSLSSNIVNTTNTLLLPTNTSTFNGDTAVVIHAGGSGSATAIRQAGQTSNLIVLTNFDHAVRFLYFNNAWDFYHNLAYVEPIYFSGTNAAANAAASRTNLGLGAVSQIDPNSFSFNVPNASTYIVVTDEELTTGYDAPIGSYGAALGIASYIKYGSNNSEWGKIIHLDNSDSGQTARTNLGIPLAALTNTNNANFQAAVFATNTAPASAAQFGDRAAWMEITVQTNGSNVSFRIPLYK